MPTSTGSRRRPGSSPRARSCDWATLGGAEVAGIADRTGSITPGKKADIVIIDTKAVNVAPVIDPVGAVVCAADISNVRTVLVDGEILKDDFRLKADLAAPRKGVEASRDYLLSKFGDPEPGWLPAEGRPSRRSPSPAAGSPASDAGGDDDQGQDVDVPDRSPQDRSGPPRQPAVDEPAGERRVQLQLRLAQVGEHERHRGHERRRRARSPAAG